MKRAMLLLMSGVVVASLLGRVNPACAADPANFKPTITANPAVVSLEKGVATGKTTLTYDGGKQHPFVEVWVSVNGADLKKVLEDEGDGKGTRTVDVQLGKKYRYVLTDFGKELASVEVTVKSKSDATPAPTPGAFKPTISADPRVVTLFDMGKNGKTRLAYDGGKAHPNVEVWVSVNGADATKVLEDEGDGKGTRVVDVQLGKKYRYILTDFGKELASVEVITKLPADTTPAPPGTTTPTTKPGDLGAAIVKFAAARVGQKGLGDGECTRLVEQALAAAGAKPGKGFVWGRELKAGEAMQPGDIIQFTSCVFKDGAATWNLGIPNHTAIVEKASGAKVTLLHQNVDGAPASEKSRIRRLDLDLASKTSGSFVTYRPEPK